MMQQHSIWKLSQPLEQNYLMVIADLLRYLFQTRTETPLSDIYLHAEPGALEMKYPHESLFTEQEIREAYATLIGGLGKR